MRHGLFFGGEGEGALLNTSHHNTVFGRMASTAATPLCMLAHTFFFPPFPFCKP